MTRRKLTPLLLAKKCRSLVNEKKAVAPVILDLRELSTVSDYYVICSADSEPQLKALANHVEKELKDNHDLQPFAVDGFPKSQWVIVDYGSVMLHLFHATKRKFYDLEELWRDAPRVK